MIKKRASKPKAVAVKNRELNIGELADLLLSVSPELSEAYTRADIELALDDRGWLGSAASMRTTETDAQTRTAMVAKSRLYWLRDPLAKQAVRLWTDYSLGTGITYTCKDEATMKKLDLFMKDRRNRRVLNSEGQRKSSKKTLIDGEIFFAIFTEDDGSKVIRWIDPLQITDIISDPDDTEHILGYRRQLPFKHGSQPKAVFYADWTATDEDIALGEQQKIQNQSVVFEDDVVVYHLPFDSLSQRGNGLLSSSIDWAREHRRFMEARVAITQSLSKYAYKLSVKGGQGAVNKIKTQLQSTYATTQSSTVEKNPQTAPGGTWVQNDAIDLNAVPRATGAGDSEKDGNQLKLMFGAGVGIMLHYFGDPSTGNLATATAMELPMLKMFDSYQEFWKSAYHDIFSIVLDEDGDAGSADAEADDDYEIVIDLPPILADDLQQLGAAFGSFSSMWPELADDDEILTMVLTALRVNNIDDVVKSLREKKVKRDEKAKQDQIDTAKLMGGASSMLKPKEAAALTAALLEVAKGLQL